MLNRIKDIQSSLDNELYLSALALSLTIPDICGQIEYSDLRIKGKRSVGEQYMRWFDEWVSHFYSNSPVYAESKNKAKKPFFSGRMCYKLRCCFLHSGNSEIGNFGIMEDSDHNYEYMFELCINCSDSYQEKWSETELDNGKITKVKLVRIDIAALCDFLCISAKSYYELKGEELFIDKSIKIIDIKKEFNKIVKINQHR